MPGFEILTKPQAQVLRDLWSRYGFETFTAYQAYPGSRRAMDANRRIIRRLAGFGFIEPIENEFQLAFEVKKWAGGAGE